MDSIDPLVAKPLAVALALLPCLTVFGNVLVLLAVCFDRTLHTVTNFLIVSLAVSDLLWNGFVWDLGPGLCKLYIGMDVACSTASILNLLAISLDRYIAITYPVAYAQYGSQHQRAFLSISLVWTISGLVAIPVFLGANQVADNSLSCEFTNAYFIIVSSVLSFFVPCAAMILLYSVIFCRLRQRSKARSRRRTPKLPHDRQESEHISTALLSGAQIARQVGQQLKRRADQLFYEYSIPTSDMHSNSSSSWDDYSSVNTLTHDSDSPKSSKTTDRATRVAKAVSSPAVHFVATPERPPGSPNHLELPGAGLSLTHSDETMECAVMETDVRSLEVPPLQPGQPDDAYGNDFTESIPFIDGLSGADTSNLASRMSAMSRRTPTTPDDTDNQFDGADVNDDHDVTEPLNDDEHLRRTSGSSQILLPSDKKIAFDTLSLPVTAIDRSDQTKKFKHSLTIESPSFMTAIFGGFWRSNTIDKTFKLHESKSTDILKLSRWAVLRKLLIGIRSTAKPSRRLVKKASKQLKREQKATITLAVVLAVFLVCWVPFFSFHLGNALCMLIYGQNCTNFLVSFGTTWLGYLNSSVNPLIYTVFDYRFRRSFRSILRC